MGEIGYIDNSVIAFFCEVNKIEKIVTVGMCVKNGEKFVGGAITSILQQNYPSEKLEIIYVDDGSTDNTVQVINSFMEKSNLDYRLIKVDWGGTGPARNIITNNASGKYILWVDSDNIMEKNYLRSLVKYIDSNDSVGIVSGIVDVLDKNNILLYLELLPTIMRRIQDMVLKNFDPTRLPGTACSIYRVKALKSIGGFDVSITGAGEDQDAAWRIWKKGWKIHFFNAKFYETHANLNNWKDLLSRYYWHGKTSYILFKKGKNPFKIYRMSSPSAFISGVINVIPAYKLIHKKWVFLLPIHNMLKQLAWCYGFLRAQVIDAREVNK